MPGTTLPSYRRRRGLALFSIDANPAGGRGIATGLRGSCFICAVFAMAAA